MTHPNLDRLEGCGVLGALEGPIRAELFGIEHLEHHAQSLAAAHRTGGPAQPTMF
jgi:hypothetical protein